MQRIREMPETEAELEKDSRWPALFPSAICLVTSDDGEERILEKVTGGSIVNRFPYVLALSFCQEALSSRHYRRSKTMEIIERSGKVAVQFLMPGPGLTRAMAAIAEVPEDRMEERMVRAGLPKSQGQVSGAPIFDSAYLVYEGRLVAPGRDFEGKPINQSPTIDCGSHLIYLFEIQRISLAPEIAAGTAPLHWRALPVWTHAPNDDAPDKPRAKKNREALLEQMNYVKPYRPDYVFPTRDTVAFAGKPMSRAVPHGAHVLDLPSIPLAGQQVDNDSARWPCFFPSSLGVITARAPDGTKAAFPCGSTTVLGRHPMIIGISVSYARINERYAPRASLEVVRAAGRFVCGVAVYQPAVLEAIRFLGNVSLRDTSEKVENCGLTPRAVGNAFSFAELPVQFECRIVREIPLGTHCLLLGEVEKVLVDARLSSSAPLEWCPWAGQQPVEHLASQ
jgi:flavin reductase (DIM6/NTAB) family NADH-FMN oxidoreductase RutF